jgi:hypothetical protein
VTYVNLYSDYGNVPFLQLFDASYLASGSVAPANITMYTNAAAGKRHVYSGHELCGLAEYS